MSGSLPDVLRHSPVEVVFGPGRLAELGNRAAGLGARRVLLVTDCGIVAAGHAALAIASLQAAGIAVQVFSGVRENPTTDDVAAGVHAARPAGAASPPIDMIIGLGGGSSMDCAKGINLLLTNGGEIADYWGIDKARRPLLPMIAIPTTAGTGSEAQSFALISDPRTHRKMACGVRALPAAGGLRPRLAILDPDLTASQPAEVAAAVGIDAVAHCVETAGCRARTEVSLGFSREAWRLIEPNYEQAVHAARAAADVPVAGGSKAADVTPAAGGSSAGSNVPVLSGSIAAATAAAARSAMLLGAHLAGAAIEHSMLGAAHAAANPLTAMFKVVHGRAVGLLLPHVIRHNAARAGGNPYAALGLDPAALAHRVERMLDAAGLPRTLSQCGVPAERLPELAAMATEEWTARFNPVDLSSQDFLAIYNAAL